MLITIVHTVSYGKVVLHKYPYERIHLLHEGLQKLQSSQIIELVSQTFDNFGMYRKQKLLETNSGGLPEKAVVEMFMANQKFSQVTLGIDDDCVLVTKSAFLSSRKTYFLQETQKFSQNVGIFDVHETIKSQIISITLIWRQESFEKVEETKHRLAFLLGILERKEQHEQFLTKEVIKIMEERQRLKRKIKDIFTTNIKENYEEVKLKILIRQIQTAARLVRDQLALFCLLKKYQECWQRGQNFEMKQAEYHWEGTIGSSYEVGQPPQEFIQRIRNKTLVILPPKLNELPSVLYSGRVRHQYQKGLSMTNYSIKKLLNRNRDIQASQLYHTAYFLLKNNFAVDIYPIDHPFSYNLFYLKELPNKSLIQKFNSQIFKGKNFLEIVSEYSKYKLAFQEEETLKYLLLKGIVSEVEVYIYKKYGVEEGNSREGQESTISNTLQKYNMTDRDLNYMLASQPSSTHEGTLLGNVIKFMKNHHPKEWGFYFVQKSSKN